MGKDIKNSSLLGELNETKTPAQKKQKSKSVTVKKQKEISKLADTVIFSPSSSQAKVKARFWTRYQTGPLAASSLSITEIQRITGSSSIPKWWAEPGFPEWFLNKDEERERLRYLFNRGLDTMEEILCNPEANANAKANIIKMLAEMNGYLGKRPEEKFADEQINKMSENQLIAFLEKKGVRITQETVIDTEAGKTDDSGE